jgi:SsrA-binding protein
MKNSATIENRKAKYDYFIEETLECGIELRGNEVKSIRSGKASIKEAWVSVESGEMVIKQMHITPWETSNRYDVSEVRERKLLAHKAEIRKLSRAVQRDGYTLVPLKVYFSDNGKCKVLVGLCKGKKNYDKREAQKERDIKRSINEKLKRY